MSQLLAGRVWHSGLDGRLKPVAAALADVADRNNKVYPSVDYVAWLCGCSKRSVQRAMHELFRLGVIEMTGARDQDDKVLETTIENLGKGGRGRRTEYRLVPDKLPSRAPWSETVEAKKQNGDKLTLFSPPKDDKPNTERVTKTPQKGDKNDKKEGAIIRSFIEPEDLLTPTPQIGVVFDTVGLKPAPKVKPYTGPKDPDPLQVLLARHRQLAADLPGAEGKAPTLNGRHTKAFQGWLKAGYSVDDIKRAQDHFFACREPFVVRRGHCWNEFETRFHAFVRGVQDTTGPTTGRKAVVERANAAAVKRVAENPIYIAPECR